VSHFLRRTCLILLFLPGFALSQVSDSLTTMFRQELDTRLWRVQENIRVDHTNFSLRSSGYSSLTERRLSGYESQWKTDLSATIDLSRRLTNDIDLLIEMVGQDFRDREAAYITDRGQTQVSPTRFEINESSTSRSPLGQNSRIARSTTRTGLEYSPRPDFETSLLVGGSFDDQIEGSGEGFSGSSGLYWGSVFDSDFDVEADGWVNQYADRQNHHVFTRGLTLNQFGDATNQLAASWRNRRSDLFFGTSGQIVSRVSEEIRIDNRLAGPISPSITGIYDLSYRKTNVDYRGGGPGPGDEMDLINRFSMRSYWGYWLGELSYQFGLEDRTYGDLILGKNQVLTLLADWKHGPDSLSFRASTEKWRYDSPDSLETSDRDRLIHRISSGSSFRILDRTQLTLDALVLLDHVVNLHRQRSVDNRWNRVFRLSPGVEWKPASGWRNHAVFEILANYTDYDFEEETGSVRSNVYRRWSAADTVNVPLPLELKGTFSGRLDLEDRGRLRWDDFIQEVSDEKRAWFWTASLAKLFWSHMLVEAGYRSQRREEDRFDLAPDGSALRTRINTYQVSGPFFRLETRSLQNLRVAVEVDLQNVQDDNPSGRDRLDRIETILVYRW
jgi:hypothetical protein